MAGVESEMVEAADRTVHCVRKDDVIDVEDYSLALAVTPNSSNHSPNARGTARSESEQPGRGSEPPKSSSTRRGADIKASREIPPSSAEQ